jgi:acetyltransferase-like isoleucine patch superfamily enzyme
MKLSAAKQVSEPLLNWLSIILIFFPSFLKIPIYRVVFRYKIGKDVRIGLAWIKVGRLVIGDHVRIGHLTRIKGIPLVQVGDHTSIGVGNTFTATYEFTNEQSQSERGNHPALFIGRHVGITMFHYLDVQDEFMIGDFTTIAGRNSFFYTHFLDTATGTQSTRPIHIGSYCMIGAAVRFSPGATVPNCCVVGMGAVVTKRFNESYTLLGGNPARIIRLLPEDSKYFHRHRGWIGTYSSPLWRDE